MTRPGINDIITLLVGLPEPDNKENQIVYQQTLCIKGRHLFCEAFFSKKMGKHIETKKPRLQRRQTMSERKSLTLEELREVPQ